MRYEQHKFLLGFFVLAFLMMSHNGFSQVGITAALPPGNLCMRSQLWNISLSNSASRPGIAVLKLEMRDLQTRQIVLTATTNRFVLPLGATMVQQQSLEPVIYNSFLSTSGNFLPVGQYEVCYQLSYNQSGSDATYSSGDCEQVMVEPLSPPVLIFPENDSIVAGTAPTFSWVPPAPAAMFSNLNYDIQVSELYDGQSPADAIQNNLPLQYATHLEQPFFVYPSNGPQLEQGKKYVWQIIAKDAQKTAARSETWVFRKDSIKTSNSVNNTVFLLIDDRTHTPGTADSAVLRVKYTSHVPTYLAQIAIKDENDNVLSSGKREIREGDNFLEFALNRKYQKGPIYTIVIRDAFGQTHSLKFTCR